MTYYASPARPLPPIQPAPPTAVRRAAPTLGILVLAVVTRAFAWMGTFIGLVVTCVPLWALMTRLSPTDWPQPFTF